MNLLRCSCNKPSQNKRDKDTLAGLHILGGSSPYISELKENVTLWMPKMAHKPFCSYSLISYSTAHNHENNSISIY